MGLDMYIYGAKKKKSLDIEAFVKKLNEDEWVEEEMYADRESANDTLIELAYWRKAHTIHKWFVDNVQDGVDECFVYIINDDILFKLLEYIETSIKEVLKIIGPNFKIEDHWNGKIYNLTDDMHLYLELTNTKELIEKVIQIDKKDDVHLLYYSSW